MKTLKKVILMVAICVAIVAISNISNAATVRVTGDTLNVRKEASTSSDVIAMLSEGVECELLGEEGDFYKVKYQNYTGYVSKQYAEKIGDNSETTSSNNNEGNSNTSDNNVENNQNNEEQENTTNNEDNNTNSSNNSENTVDNNLTNESSENNDASLENTSTTTEKTLVKNTDIRILPLVYSSVLENNKEDIKVLVITEINGWSYIQTDEINGWVRTDKLTSAETSENQSNKDNESNEETNSSEEENSSEFAEKTGYISEEYVNVRSGPSTKDKIIKVLILNAEVTITGEEGDWYKVKSGEDVGYISKEFISDTKKKTVSRSSDVRRTSNNNENANNKEEITQKEEDTESKNNNTTKGEEVVAYAKKYLGYPYVYGAAGSSSFDCSGFTMYVYKHFGINLPHGATSQSRYGTKVSKNNLQPGDIVFLTDYETGVGIGHCGIYVGDGNFIHASTTGYKVRISSLDVEYAGRFYSAIRLL